MTTQNSEGVVGVLYKSLAAFLSQDKAILARNRAKDHSCCCNGSFVRCYQFDGTSLFKRLILNPSGLDGLTLGLHPCSASLLFDWPSHYQSYDSTFKVCPLEYLGIGEPLVLIRMASRPCLQILCVFDSLS